MEKVKLTKEKVEGLKIFCNSSKENCIHAFIHYNGSFESNLAMNKVSLDELISYLYDNYELEVSPEEKILNAYNAHVPTNGLNDEEYCRGWKNGLNFALKQYAIKIKGINEE